MTIDVLPGDPPGLARLVELLRAGAVVGFPTDTVYGLAALASDERAVQRVFDIKGRPIEHTISRVRGDSSQYFIEVGGGKSAGRVRLRQPQLEVSLE